MRKNLYYSEVMKPDFSLYKKLHSVLFLLAFFPKMWIQVFTRKNFGERYFNFTTAAIFGAAMLILPMWLPQVSGMSFFRKLYNLVSMFPDWYAFTVCFIVMAWMRKKEIEKSVSSFDFGKYSLYSGDVIPFFVNIAKQNKAINFRRLEVWVEPGAFFVLGIILSRFSIVGFALILASILLWMVTAMGYYLGDQFVLDKIDEMIINKDFEKNFMGDDSEWAPKNGVRFNSKKPQSEEHRNELLGSMFETDGKDFDFST